MDEFNNVAASESVSETDDRREEIKVKLRQYFDGKIVRKILLNPLEKG